MAMMMQLFNRQFLTQQRAHFASQIKEFGRTTKELGKPKVDTRAAIGDLSIVAPATFLQAAIILDDAAIKATQLAEKKAGKAVAQAQLEILRKAISEMILEIVREGGDIKFDSGDKMYDPALMKILEKSAGKH